MNKPNSANGIPTLLGIPFDGQSSFLRGAGEAPGKIREALACDASNQWTETGVDLGAAVGDLRSRKARRAMCIGIQERGATPRERKSASPNGLRA